MMVRNWKVWGVLGLLLALVVVVGYGQPDVDWTRDPATSKMWPTNIQDLVGIGTQNPDTKLTVTSGVLNAIRTRLNDSLGGQWGVVIGAAHPEEGNGGRIFGHNPAIGPSPDNAQGWVNLYINSWGRHTILNLNMGNVGIGTATPKSKLGVKGLPTLPPDASGVAGMLCITNNGNIWIDTTPGTPCY